MSFPFPKPISQQPLEVELFYDDDWRSITKYVRAEPELSISRGRKDEASQTDPARCEFIVNNRDGRFSPRNPRSPLWGKIGRNTPVRVRLGEKDVVLYLNPVGGDETDQYAFYERADMGPEFDFTGDHDIRIDLESFVWRAAGPLSWGLARRYVNTGDNRSWALLLDEDGIVAFLWSSDGTFAARETARSTVAVPYDVDRLALRVTLDVDNGASGHTVRFYTAPTMEGPWTQLGADVVGSGTTSVAVTTADLELGRVESDALPGIDSKSFGGIVHGFELRDGIDGTIIASPDFGNLGNWQVTEAAALLDLSIRFIGEVSAWPPRWDLSDRDVWVPVECSGITRRLSQGQKAIDSSLFRTISTASAAVGYWPMEEMRGSIYGSGLGDSTRGSPDGNVDRAAYRDLPSSKPLPLFSDDGQVTFTRVPTYTPHTDQRVLMYFHALQLPDATQQQILDFRTSGSARRWVVDVHPDGHLSLKAFDNSNPPVELVSTPPIIFDVLNRQLLVSVWLQQNGADIFWEIGTAQAHDSQSLVFNGTLTNHTYDQITSLIVGGAASPTRAAIGHVLVLNEDVRQVWADAIHGGVLEGFDGQSAGERMLDLATEYNLTLRLFGDAVKTSHVGPEPIVTLLEVFRDAADVDFGFLGEDPYRLGLLYRTRFSLYNQVPRLTLDYSTGTIAQPIEPTDDDQQTRNDIHLERTFGSRFQATQQSGPLSVQAPPDGVGRYETSYALNLHIDGQLPNHAYWRLHMGTVDEQRYPMLRLDLSNPRMEPYLESIKRITEGDRIQITNTPAWLPPGPIDLIVLGWVEQIGMYTRSIAFNCAPASPWNVGIVEDDVFGRVDSESSTLFAGISESDTVFNVTHDSAFPWVTDAAEFPFDVRVDEEVMTVTSIAVVAGNTQSFTVTRAVNGVRTTHAAGSALGLAYPAILGL